EVRELASKSATAAKEIEALIAESTATVQSGSKLVADAGMAIQNIVRQVQTAASRMTDISKASHDQSRKADEVTNAMREIEAGTQHNADMASQAAAATEALRNEARMLIASIEMSDQERPQHIDATSDDGIELQQAAA
ncbi:MAG TPA: methyl-accepting chemotaxis protein, partial [Povalibacter sp.]|nr:methyl-accepting chemotaxis protein [Povalibacter sp.]